MIEAIVEGGGVLVGMALLLYFQVIRPGAPSASTKTQDAADREEPEPR